MKHSGDSLWMFTYDLENNTSHDLVELPRWCDQYTAFAAHNNRVVFTGGSGYNKANTICELELDNQRLVEIGHLPSSIQCAGLSVDSTDVHVIGGYRHTISWYWKTTDDHYCFTQSGAAFEMKQLSDMNRIAYWPLIVRDGNTIYALGGATGGKWVNVVQKYDIQQDNWEEFERIPEHATTEDSGAVLLSGNVYIFTPERVLNLNLRNREWHTFKHQKDVKAFGAIIYNGRILVIASDNTFEYQPNSRSFISLNKKIPAKYTHNIFVN